MRWEQQLILGPQIMGRWSRNTIYFSAFFYFEKKIADVQKISFRFRFDDDY
jgi:hypothetical protein